MAHAQGGDVVARFCNAISDEGAGMSKAVMPKVVDGGASQAPYQGIIKLRDVTAVARGLGILDYVPQFVEHAKADLSAVEAVLVQEAQFPSTLTTLTYLPPRVEGALWAKNNIRQAYHGLLSIFGKIHQHRKDAAVCTRQVEESLMCACHAGADAADPFGVDFPISVQET